MEAKTARNRSAETRHSRTVRWFINQYEAVKERVEAKAGASIDKAPAWVNDSCRPASRVSVRKKVSCWMEQAELWPTESSETMSPVDDGLLVTDALQEIHEAPAVPPPPPPRRPAKAAPRKAVAVFKPGPAERVHSNARRVNTIARYLKVNGAIEVPRENGIYFDFPGRGHFQALRLWSGSGTEAPDHLSIPS